MSLDSLWRDSIISTGDRLRLRFKCKSFFTTVCNLGILDGIHSDIEQLSSQKYANLTEWVNTCISEFSEHTPIRISAFKRVYHLPSKLNICTLRKIQSLFGTEPTSDETLRLFLSELFSYATYLKGKLANNNILHDRSDIFDKILYCRDKKLQMNKINESKQCGQELVLSSLLGTQNAQ